MRDTGTMSLNRDQITGIIIVTLLLTFGGLLAAMVIFSPYHPPTAAQIQQQQTKQQQEYQLQMNCENHRGTWDNYNYHPGVCKFK